MNIAQQLINGLVLGSGYALIAIGWTVLLGAARLVNFAHGQLYMLGAFVAWAVMTKLGVNYFLAVPIAVVALGLLGVVLQGLMLRPVMQQNLTSLMIVTLGFGYVFQGGASRLFGGDPERFVSPLQSAEIRFGEIWFTWQDVLTLVGTLVLFGVLWLVLNRTRVGAIVRSVAEDPKLAQLFGINAVLVYIGVFVFECAAVALGAGLVAPRSPILTSMGFDEVILTFVVVVLGGIGSVTGSLVAGFGLGLFTALFGALVSSAYTTAAAFFVLLAFLVLRPRGLAAR
ncbi:MAG TPA: branched-chain amino acid ABC transporter permease [Reyranella sp.]|jgi:branched-chain amino acid transport system permease protein|nr:branched-chain amino acid ABC transporter permease [Reyranella sp.]